MSWSALAADPAWARHRELLDRWLLEPLCEDDGHSPEEIAQAEAALGAEFPAPLREWYALLGRRLTPGSGFMYLPLPLFEVQLRTDRGQTRLWICDCHQSVCDFSLPASARGVSSEVVCYSSDSVGTQRARWEPRDFFYWLLVQQVLMAELFERRFVQGARFGVVFATPDEAMDAEAMFEALDVVKADEGQVFLGDEDLLVGLPGVEPWYAAARTAEAWEWVEEWTENCEETRVRPLD